MPHWSGVMAAFAAKALAVDVGVVAENGIASRNPEGNGSRGAMVTFAAVFFSGNTEGLLAVMAGATGLAPLHLCHRKGTLLRKVEDGTVAYLAVFVFRKVDVMAEDNCRSVLEAESNVFSLHRKRHQHGNSRCKEG